MINNKIRTEANGELMWSLAYALKEKEKGGMDSTDCHEKYFKAKTVVMLQYCGKILATYEYPRTSVILE